MDDNIYKLIKDIVQIQNNANIEIIKHVIDYTFKSDMENMQKVKNNI